MRKIYAIEVIERDGDDTAVTFTKVLPDVPTKGKKIKTREELEARVHQLDEPEHVKTSVLNGISFTLDMWFPRNFYRITKIDWKH